MSKKQVGKYILDKRIGKGSYAQVWLGHAENTLETVAVKVIARHTVSETAQLRQEVAILKKIDHGNIVKFKDLKKSTGHYYLVLEYCEGGDLARFLQKHGKVSEAAAQGFLRQLSAGLLVLHGLNFIHRDLKPQNVLMTDMSESATLKIADFGFARSLNPTDMAATVCGSPLYMAPEILRHERYDARADLWSLGAIFYELLFGTPPFTGPNPIQLLATIESAPKRMTFPSPVSQECQSLLSAVLDRDPQDRISPERFFSHEYNLGPSYRSSKPENGGAILEHEDMTLIEEQSPVNISSFSPDQHEWIPDEDDDELVCISFGATEPQRENGIAEESPPVVVHTDSLMRTLSEASYVRPQGVLADTYTGSQVALAVLLRYMAKEMVSGDDSRAVDALGVIYRSIKFLDEALNETSDKTARGIIDLELKVSLEVAISIRSKLSYRGFTESARPLRWVYAFIVSLMHRECGEHKQLLVDNVVLLVDFLLHECDQMDPNIDLEEREKDRMQDVLNDIRSSLQTTE